MITYLDNCCYNRSFDDQKQRRIYLETLAIIRIQKKIMEGEIELATSFILDYENRSSPYEEQRIKIEDFYRSYSKVYIGVERADRLRELAEKIIAEGIKEKDAYHVASAILAQCDFFITVDDRLLKYRSDDITLINPIDFVKIWGEKDDG